MRLLKLRLIDDHQSTLRLHPRLTVVTGLSPAARGLVVDGLAGLFTGEDHGLVAEADDGRTVAADRPGITAITATTVPGGVATRAPAAIVVRSVVARVAADAQPSARTQAPAPEGAARSTTYGSATRAAHNAQLTAAEASLAAATASLGALQSAVDATRAEQRRIADARRAADHALEAARSALDPFALAGLEAAIDAARHVEVELGTEPGACRGDTLESVRTRIARLEHHGDTITGALAVLAQARPGRVVEALDVVRLAAATGPITPPEALRLADEWVVLREHLGALEAKMASEDGGVHSVSDRLEAARARVAACEAAMAPAPVDQRDIQALEAAHETVLAAERKASSRLGGSRARKALDDAIAEERAILERLGFPTWSAWVMGAALLDSTAQHTRELEAARSELALATAAWEATSEKLESDPEFRALLDRLERVLRAAHAIVGDVPDIEAALRALRVEPGPPPCPLSQARTELGAALRDAGLAVEEHASVDQLRVQAETWLAVVQALRAARRQLEIDAGHVGDLLDAARDTLDRIEASGPAEPGDGFGRERLLSARSAIESAERHLDGHFEAIGSLAQLAGEAARLAELERQTDASLDAKVELLVMTEHLVDAAAGKVRTIERRLERPATGPERGFHRAGPAGRTGHTRRSDDEGAPNDVRAGSAPGEPRREADALIAALGARLAALEPPTGDADDLEGWMAVGVLDDPLATTDGETLTAVLDWLERTAEHRQIVYVTDREDVAAWALSRPAEAAGLSTGSGFFG